MVRPLKKQRVLLLTHPDLIPPDSTKGMSERELNPIKTEVDVITTLRKNGHEVKALGVQTELTPIRDTVAEWQPDIVWNMLEEFHGEPLYDQNVAAYLELLRVPFTGCNSRGLVLARGKDLSKSLLHYHRVPVPQFAVFPRGRVVRRPRKLGFPLIVKSLDRDASQGISQASVVDSDEKLAERVAFIHEHVGSAAIAEQFIAGRELYVGVFGNERRHVLPVWELEFGNLREGTHAIATEKVKHDVDYQERRGVLQGPAENLPPAVIQRIKTISRRVCRVLELDGYARIDYRLAEDGTPYFIEANPNPEIAQSQEFAESAKHEGIAYGQLLDRILALGLARAGKGAD